VNTNNLLNQITGRDYPGSMDILGIAHASSTVTEMGSAQSIVRGEQHGWSWIGTAMERGTGAGRIATLART